MMRLDVIVRLTVTIVIVVSMGSIIEHHRLVQISGVLAVQGNRRRSVNRSMRIRTDRGKGNAPHFLLQNIHASQTTNHSFFLHTRYLFLSFLQNSLPYFQMNHAPTIHKAERITLKHRSLHPLFHFQRKSIVSDFFLFSHNQNPGKLFSQTDRPL